MNMNKDEMKKRIRAVRTVTGKPADPIITAPTEKDIKEAIIVYGRFNPPTIGHERLVQEARMISLSRFGEMQEGHIGPNSECAIIIATTMSEGSERNPLPLDLKLSLLDEAFGNDGNNAIVPCQDLFHLLKDLSEEGVTDVTLVLGSDQASVLFDRVLKYAGDLYEFDSLICRQIGRLDESVGVEGVSATILRQMLSEGSEEAVELLPEKIRHRVDEIKGFIRVKGEDDAHYEPKDKPRRWIMAYKQKQKRAIEDDG